MVEVEFNPSPQNNPMQIYINKCYGSNRRVGRIRLASTLSFETLNNTEDNNLSARIMNFTREYFTTKSISSQRIVNWLQKPQTTGIREVLGSLNVSDKTQLVIGFLNNKIRLILDYLRAFDNQFSMSMIREANKYCSSGEEFVSNLIKQYRKHTQKNINLDDFERFNAEELIDLFNSIRVKNDTERAIYRLSILGIISDYVVDYNNETYIVEIQKLNSFQITVNLRRYLQKYISVSRTEKLLSVIDQTANGIQVLDECLQILTGFVYSEIVEKRRSAIKDMEVACEYGLDEAGNMNMKQYINLYFNAKYLRDIEIEDETYNLKTDTEGKTFSTKILWKYIDVTLGKVDNLKHLLGSSVRLLNDDDENGALLIMKAFATYLLNISDNSKITNQRLISEAANDLIKGIFAFKSEEQQSVATTFLKKITAFNPSIKTTIEDVLATMSIKRLSISIKEFNDKFLQNYEQRNRTNSK